MDEQGMFRQLLYQYVRLQNVFYAYGCSLLQQNICFIKLNVLKRKKKKTLLQEKNVFFRKLTLSCLPKMSTLFWKLNKGMSIFSLSLFFLYGNLTKFDLLRNFNQFFFILPSKNVCLIFFKNE